MASKTLRKLRRQLVRQQWRERATGSGHWLMYCPCGEHTITVPESPSGGKRGEKNLVAELNRTCWDGS